ncbi:FxsA family protein [Sulfurirhabdus autotrophica]|uniref:UPF0716 protein FxsA n=1 Tax=Sulfurirhabdus autotrophica TaxID=1706046 RepID=A0A4R3Y3S5_9PROT|nr:FxsA family protein [Sulfurirhabdus autotrophica]TCV86380.1 UPF0716 protein FxsA [Sulfurirhabdus autotrophica]
MRSFGFIFLIILLGFPALEIYTLFQVAHAIGWWLLPWLIFTTGAGWVLIQEERLAIFGRLMLAIQSGQSPFGALWDSGRTMVAGVLLIFPGVWSDALAFILLLFPRQSAGGGASQNTPADDGVIEGEWRRVNSEKLESRDKV